MIHYTTSTKKDGAMDKEETITKFTEKEFGKCNLVLPNLQHGDKIHVIKDFVDLSAEHECDGLITGAKDYVVLGVKGSDCFPVFFLSEKLIGIAHCGWRGVIKEMPRKMIERMEKEGAARESIRVIIGPGIQACHFEVKNDVWDQFYDTEIPGMKLFVDLPMFIKMNLNTVGVQMSQIEDQGECTYCLKKKYFSHRRDKVEPIEHQLSIIGFK